MLKAILFDMDDTLVDWATRHQDWPEYDRTHLRGVFEYVNRELHPLPDFETFVRAAQQRTVEAWMRAGRNLRAPHLGRTIIQTLRAFGVPEALLDESECLRAYGWRGIPGAALFPDVTEHLPRYRQHGLKLGLITNAYQPMWMRDRELATLGLDPALFHCRVSSADVGYLKPHPAVFEHTLRELGVHPDEAVFIGDNPEADVAGAQAVGMRAVLRVNFSAPPMISGLIVPDAAINTLHELPTHLDGWFPGWQNGSAPPATG